MAPAAKAMSGNAAVVTRKVFVRHYSWFNGPVMFYTDLDYVYRCFLRVKIKKVLSGDEKNYIIYIFLATYVIIFCDSLCDRMLCILTSRSWEGWLSCLCTPTFVCDVQVIQVLTRLLYDVSQFKTFKYCCHPGFISLVMLITTLCSYYVFILSKWK